jgi:hypothetical protein
MTKLAYDADFRVFVRPEMWERHAPESQYFVGIYTVYLNTHVIISFIPDVSDSCPPWRQDLAPHGEEATSELEARAFQALISEYSVTPNVGLAGQIEVIELPSPKSSDPELEPWAGDYVDPEHGTIWYVSPDEWRSLIDELEGLREVAYSDVHSVRFSEVAHTRLGRFLEERFLPSGRLSAMDLRILRRA